jgi:hypothetical protein
MNTRTTTTNPEDTMSHDFQADADVAISIATGTPVVARRAHDFGRDAAAAVAIATAPATNAPKVANASTFAKVACLTVSQIESVYSGRDHKCCCGCSGTHYPNTGKTPMVAKVLRLLQANPGEVKDDGSCLSIVYGARLYIAYLN